MGIYKRDIRADIKERLADAYNQRKAAVATVAALNNRIEMLEGIMAAENARYHANGADPERRPLPETPLLQFVLDWLGERESSTKDDLRDAAMTAGYLADSNFPGRSLHALLVNMSRRDQVDLDGEIVKLRKNLLTEPKTRSAG